MKRKELNKEVSFKILKEYNKWWSNNLDLLEGYIHDKILNDYII